MRVSREELKRFLDGHRIADALLRAETLRRLPLLSVEDARAEYDSLCRVWEQTRELDTQALLDRRAIQDRVALRRRLSGRR